MSVKDIDKGFRKVIEECKALGDFVAVVGVYGQDAEKKEANGTTVLDVAKAHEFGTSTIPKRSFLRQGVDKGRDKIAERFKKAAANVLDRKSDARQELGIIGELGRAFVLDQFRTGGDPKWEALEPRTVARRRGKISKAQSKAAQRRGDSPTGVTTLVDTGNLRQSIHSEVRGRE